MQIVATSIQRVTLALVLALVFQSSGAEKIVENLKVGGSFLTSRINSNMDTEASS